MHYDIIGDIHGYADKLEELLLKLGYVMQCGIYQHQDREAVFVDDQFLDNSDIPFYNKDNKPVFFGHYWMIVVN